MQQRIVFLDSNDNPGAITLFLENLLVHKTLEKRKPLYIESSKKIGFPKIHDDKIKDKYKKLFDWHPIVDIAILPIERLKIELQNKKSLIPNAIKDFSNIYFFDDVNFDTLNLIELSDCLLLIIKNDSFASSFLYKILKLLLSENIMKKIFIVISGVKFIEDAATMFIKLQAEMQNIIEYKNELIFCGFLYIDIQKQAVAKLYGLPFIKRFFEGSFHGMIKFMDNKLNFEIPEQGESFLTKFSKLIT